MEQYGLLGRVASPINVSYLADMMLLLRYFEAEGEIRCAISAIKKRSGSHERMIREFHIGAEGIQVGQPLNEFRGVLRGSQNTSAAPAPYSIAMIPPKVDPQYRISCWGRPVETPSWPVKCSSRPALRRRPVPRSGGYARSVKRARALSCSRTRRWTKRQWKCSLDCWSGSPPGQPSPCCSLSVARRAPRGSLRD